MSRVLWWPEDGSDEWLYPIDGQLGIIFLEYALDRITTSQLEFLEVGVWKGAWSSVMLKNIAEIRGYGIDPYPGRGGFEQNLISRFERIGVADRFELFPTWEKFNDKFSGPNQLSLIHVDGEHSETAVMADLTFASKHLADRGIIVVDDYRHFWFPGIASALYKFVHESDFRPIAVTENKAYLVSSRFHAEMQNELRPIIEGAVGFNVWTSWREWDPNREFFQPSNVNGYRVLLVSAAPSQLSTNGVASQVSAPRVEQSRLAWAEWIPPAVRRPLEKIYSRLLNRQSN